MWEADNLSPALFRTNWLCLPFTKNWLSSVNMTFFQCSAVQLLCFLAHSCFFFFILSVNSCFLTGLMAFLPPMIRRFLTALALISVPVKAKSLRKSKLVFLRSNLLCLIRKVLSLEVVLRFLPHFPFLCGAADPVLVTCFYQPKNSGLVYI